MLFEVSCLGEVKSVAFGRAYIMVNMRVCLMGRVYGTSNDVVRANTAGLML